MEFLSWIFGPAKLIAAWLHASFALGAALIAIEIWLYQTRNVASAWRSFAKPPFLPGCFDDLQRHEWQIGATAFAKTAIPDLAGADPVCDDGGGGGF